MLRSATPPLNYHLRLPHGSGTLFEREIALIPADKRLAWRRYQVKAGDTLIGLSKKFKIKSAEIAALNGIEGDAVPAGLRLTIPGGKRAVKYYYSGAGGLLVGGSGRYRIARGDVLGGIARRFGVSVAQLKQWNGMSNSRIIAGRYLIVTPEGLKPRQQQRAGGVSGGSRTAGPGKYKIRRGDNLSVIAKRFGVTIHQLRAWNGMHGNSIRTGRYLVVRDPTKRATTTVAAGATRSRTKTAAAPLPAGGRYLIDKVTRCRASPSGSGPPRRICAIGTYMRGSRIRAGKELDRGVPGGRVRRPVSRRPPRPLPPRPAAAKPASGSGQYRIRSGDTLEVIARRFGVTVGQLKQWNGLRTSRISCRQVLDGFGRAGAPRLQARRVPLPRLLRPRRRVTKIRPGDTLAVIARRFGVSIAELKAWNGLLYEPHSRRQIPQDLFRRLAAIFHRL